MLTKRTNRAFLALVVGAVLAGCTTGPTASPAPGPTTTATTSTAPAPEVVQTPAAGSTDVSPTAPVSLAASGGTLRDVALTNPDGVVVDGALDAAGTTFTTAEVLGFGKTYTWSGTAVAADGTATTVRGRFTTVSPDRELNARVNIGDDQTVGIAAPVIVQFDGPVQDRAAVERAMTVTTTPATVGSWAWLPDEAEGARAHWRPQVYWTPGTVVDVSVGVYGVAAGGGTYGGSDLTTHFTIGRSQVVTADVPSHRMQVVRDGVQVMDVPVSYGAGTEDRNTTRTGVHVVTETIENKLMSNPPYYENVLEHWSVRISNNGEFIHANPQTVSVQGVENVSNGCVNLSTEDAQAYFATVLYGDPVEVTGTDVALSSADGDVWDWAVPWADWQAMSALA